MISFAIGIAILTGNSLLTNSSKIVLSEAFRKMKGRIDRNAVNRYIQEEYSEALSGMELSPETEKALEDERLRECMCQEVLAIVRSGRDLIDASGIDVHKESRESVKAELDSVVDRLRDRLWDRKKFQKHIYTGGPEFQRAVLLGIRQMMENAASMSETVRRYLDGLISEMESRTDCSVEDNFDYPGWGAIGFDECYEKLCLALSERDSVMVHGPAGSGKTELCRYFAYRYRIESGRKVLWVRHGNDLLQSIESSLHADSDVTPLDVLRKEPNLLLVIDDCDMLSDISDLEKMRCNCKRIYIVDRMQVPRSMRSVFVGPPDRDTLMDIARSNVPEYGLDVFDTKKDEIYAFIRRYWCNREVAALSGALLSNPDASSIDYSKGLEPLFDMHVRVMKDGIEYNGTVMSLLDGSYRSDPSLRKAFIELGEDTGAIDDADQKTVSELVSKGWIRRKLDAETGDYSYRLDPITSDLSKRWAR